MKGKIIHRNSWRNFGFCYNNKDLESHHSPSQQEKLWAALKIILLRCIRELRSQGKSLPSKLSIQQFVKFSLNIPTNTSYIIRLLLLASCDSLYPPFCLVLTYLIGNFFKEVKDVLREERKCNYTKCSIKTFREGREKGEDFFFFFKKRSRAKTRKTMYKVDTNSTISIIIEITISMIIEII